MPTSSSLNITELGAVPLPLHLVFTSPQPALNLLHVIFEDVPPIVGCRFNSFLSFISSAKMADPSRHKKTVFVGGLDNQVNQQVLHDAFIPFGEIVDVSLPKPEL